MRPESPASGDVAAFVLAGGRSVRFGSDKAMARLEGRTLLERALDAARGCGLEPRVVCPDPAPYRGVAGAFLASERPGRGPAEALRAVLAALDRSWALVLAADMPGVDAPLLRVLLEARDRAGAAGHTAACFSTGDGRRHPMPGLYHRSLSGLWPEAPPPAAPDRAGGRREAEPAGPEPTSLQAVLDRARVLTLGPGDTPAGPDLDLRLRNVNRPGDLGGRRPPA